MSNLNVEPLLRNSLTLERKFILPCFLFPRSEESSRDEFVVQNITPADPDVDAPHPQCDDDVDGSQSNGNRSSKGGDLKMLTREMKHLICFFCFYPDCEVQKEGGSAGHMDIVESLEESETTEVKSNRIWNSRNKAASY